jgi:hypothetical protein
MHQAITSLCCGSKQQKITDLWLLWWLITGVYFVLGLSEDGHSM